jgi:hypothetical protein
MKLTQIRSAAQLVLAVVFPIAALADISGTATVNAGTDFNFDTGTNVATHGDISFTGTSITFEGSAQGGTLALLGQSGATAFAAVTQAELNALGSYGSASPIPASSLTAGSASGTIVALGTNGGNATKFLVTAISSSSISFQYTTYTSGNPPPAGPKITSIVNGSSKIPPGFGNSGVTASSIIAIEGSNLSDPNAPVVNQDSTKGLPTTLNGTTVTAVSGSRSFPLPMYHALSFEIAAVLPAAVPAGPLTITVNYNGGSATATVTVVPSAFGMDIYNGNTAVLQDSVTGIIITPTNSAKTGEPITVWGTAVGSDPNDSDTTYSTSPHAINVSVQIYLGTVLVPQSNVLYVGSLGYPGVNGVIFNVPSNAPSGCFVSVTIVIGGVSSNSGTGSFMPNGGVCNDAAFGVNGTMISQLNSKGTTNGGSVIVAQITSPATTGGGTQTLTSAIASFSQVTGGSFSGGGFASVGSCIIGETLATGTPPTVVGLNAGTITVTTPTGGTITLTSTAAVAGFYFAQLTSGIPSTGGTFTFNGSGATGANSVGAFTAPVTFPNPQLSWNNQGAAANVNRSQGVLVTWTGGTPGSFVIISGSSSNGTASGTYTCFAPQSAQQFMVPGFVTGTLPAGNGTTTVENGTNYQMFTATGLDSGIGFGVNGFQVNTVYQ